MAVRVAINGFGRIGRLTMRSLLKKKGISVVAINDLTDNQTLAHLFKYDTMHGVFDGKVSADDEHLYIKNKKIKCSAVRNPAELPWAKMKIDVVLECTGIFLTREGASLHLEAGAKRVVLSAPPKSADIPTFVIGANHKKIKKSDKIVSNASCTTNCLTPLIMVLDKAFGVQQFVMTTIHAYTSDQKIQDAPHRDLRRSRAAAQNIIPTTTGAAKAVTLVVPHLKGKFAAQAVRVPTATGSLTDLTCVLKKSAKIEAINKAFAKAAGGAWDGILEYTEDPIVSSDIVRNPHSCIFDSKLTQSNGKLCRVVGWYDNEAGYSARLADLTEMVAKQ